MENHLKQKLSKLFQTCRSKNISDVSGEPFFFPENTHHHRQLIALFSPKPHSLSKPNRQISDENKPRYRKPKKTECISSTTDRYYRDWRSSDDETTLFSSRSDSSESFRKNRANRKSEKKLKRRSVGGFKISNQKGSKKTPLENSGKLVKDSFAVSKKSNNPYEDFRVSMVEMIVENKIFGAEDLTSLFECFISLNSDEHHRVIFEVFTEILDALVSNLD